MLLGGHDVGRVDCLNNQPELRQCIAPADSADRQQIGGDFCDETLLWASWWLITFGSGDAIATIIFALRSNIKIHGLAKRFQGME